MPRSNRLAGPAAAVVLAMLAVGLPLTVLAATPSPAASAASPTSSPCPRSLKFAGALYLDADITAAAGQVGPRLGETDPNPALCALPDRLKVFRHNGHNSTEEVVYYLDPQTPELFRSAGETGFPGSGLVRWLVVILVVGIILFAAVPAILAHLRQPPVAVGRDDTDWIQDVEADKAEPGPKGPDPPKAT